ncbi:MAG TPA: thiamine-phosphate kinase [Gammaproteobacteria bacterium]
MSVGEFDLIYRYFDRPVNDPDVVLGIGDDAAVLSLQGRAVVAVDTLVAGVHFHDTIPPDALGHRALAVNLSDLAAMGATPRWYTLALTLPKADEQWVSEFARGMFALAERYGATLVGGDLTRGPLAVTVQVVGTAGERWLTRGGGHAGDDVYVTGTLGDGAAGIALVNERADALGAEAAALKERFLRPTPRVEAGLALAGVASAAIDVSDGLLADLGHICEESGCGAVVDVEHVPLSAELLAVFPPQVALAYALGGGDDYELCFTASPANAERVESALAACGTRARRIGRLVEGRDVVCRRDGEPFEPPARGYAHF